MLLIFWVSERYWEQRSSNVSLIKLISGENAYDALHSSPTHSSVSVLNIEKEILNKIYDEKIAEEKIKIAKLNKKLAWVSE